MSKNYLFSLTITPVQNFISQARKSQDLFSGSQILSQLMGKVLETFAKEERIFPQDKEAVSNKLVVKLVNKDPKDIEDLDKKLKNFINSDFINKIFKETKQCDNNLQNFFKIYWVAVELKEDYIDEEYKESYKNLERNLGAVKNLRTFSQEAQLKDYLKCSLCGEKNVAKKVTKDDNKKDENKLCLVCLTKRKCEIKGSDNSSFPSLAKISLLDWLEKMEDSKIENYKALFTKNEFDEELFFRENLTENYFKKNSIPIEKLSKVQELLNTFDTLIQKKYYALIQFDIDDMGKKLSERNEQGQIDLSKTLGIFAQEAKKIVDSQYKNTKCTIYAGGDDFLGFVNLKYLFTVIKCIKRAFTQKANKDFPDLTFSTSIVITHYKAPLHKVLDFSRDLLNETKSHFEDKNGVGIIVLSDSAINAQTICRYKDLSLLEEMRSEKIGMSLHYKLHTIFSFIESQKNMDRDDYDSLIVMIEYEIKRLLQREKGKFNKVLYTELIFFLHTQVSGLKTSDKIKIDFENFIAYLKTLEQFKKVM